MIDRDAEIAAMVDEFLDEKPKTEAQLRRDMRIRKTKGGNDKSLDLGFSDDRQIAVQSEVIDDVIHAGVIGTEE